MPAPRRLLAGCLCAVFTTGLLAVVPATAGPVADPAADDRAVTLRLREAVRRLDAGRERRGGYDRDKFEHWIDADGDCRDTRDEVLRQESRRATTGGSCDVTGGRWFSYYDRVSWTDDDDVDIDHLVPLAEAWDSGARRWDSGTRRRFANDLRDRRSLVAVTDDVNQSKGDQDIAQWLPDFGRCRYVRQWVVVKIRWSLRVDPPEDQRLRTLAGRCRNTRLMITKATIGRG